MGKAAHAPSAVGLAAPAAARTPRGGNVSLFPHLHYELRTGAGIKGVEGIPSYFSNFRRILGSRSVDVEKGAVNTGDILDWQSSAPAGSTGMRGN